MTLKRKFLHIEISDGNLYVFADDKEWPNEEVYRLSDLDSECNTGEIPCCQVKKLRIPLDDFIPRLLPKKRK